MITENFKNNSKGITLIALILIIIVIISLGAILIFRNSSEENKKQDDIFEGKNIKADAIFKITGGGGECIETIKYYICISEMKLYYYYTFTVFPLLGPGEEYHGENDRKSLKEFDLNQEQTEKFKKLIEQVKQNNQEHKFSARNAKIIIDEIEYDVNDSSEWDELINSIKE